MELSTETNADGQTVGVVTDAEGQQIGSYTVDEDGTVTITLTNEDGTTTEYTAETDAAGEINTGSVTDADGNTVDVAKVVATEETVRGTYSVTGGDDIDDELEAVVLVDELEAVVLVDNVIYGHINLLVTAAEADGLLSDDVTLNGYIVLGEYTISKGEVSGNFYDEADKEDGTTDVIKTPFTASIDAQGAIKSVTVAATEKDPAATYTLAKTSAETTHEPTDFVAAVGLKTWGSTTIDAKGEALLMAIALPLGDPDFTFAWTLEGGDETDEITQLTAAEFAALFSGESAEDADAEDDPAVSYAVLTAPNTSTETKKVTVKVSAGGKNYASVELTILPDGATMPEVTDVTISNKESLAATLSIGDELKPVATITADENADTAVLWRAEPEDSVTIANGNTLTPTITAEKAGDVTITVYATAQDEKFDTFTFTIEPDEVPPQVTSVKIGFESGKEDIRTLKVGQTLKLYANVEATEGAEAVTWKASSDAVTIDDSETPVIVTAAKVTDAVMVTLTSVVNPSQKDEITLTIEAATVVDEVEEDARLDWIVNDYDAGDYTNASTNLVLGAVTIVTDTNKVTIEAAENEESYWKYGTTQVFTKQLKLNGSGSKTKRALKIKVTEPTTVKIYAKSGSGSEDRTLKFESADSNVKAQSKTVLGSAITLLAFDAPVAGDYYIYSEKSGINIYAISGLHTAPAPNSSVSAAIGWSAEDISAQVDGNTVSVTLPTGVTQATYAWLLDASTVENATSASYTLSGATLVVGRTYMITAEVTIAGIRYAKTVPVIYTGSEE